MEVILHIARREAWEAARAEGLYRGDTLASEGFLHCSLPRQVVPVANAHFRGQSGLVLLAIVPARVQAEIRWEPSGGEVFPHLYGPLNPDAVAAVYDFPPGAEGQFLLPEGILPIPVELARRLRAARSVVVLTGAGVSAESGIPTFRGESDSYWSQFDPMELGTVDGFLDDPELVWRWYAMRREKLRDARPNPAHLALARLERLVPHFTLATQNVDDLHERAGSRNILRLHGSLLENRCFEEARVLADEEIAWESVPPRCRQCGAYVRPGVVWFGEPLPRGLFEAAEAAMAEADLCLVVGTSAIVHPAAGLVSYLREGAALVVVNPDVTDHAEEADYFLQIPAGTALPALVDAAFGEPA